MIKFRHLIIPALVLSSGCSSNQSNKQATENQTISITNPSPFDRKEVIEIPPADFEFPMKPGMSQINNLPVEAVDEDGDQKTDRLFLLVEIPASKSIALNLGNWKSFPEFQKKTQAEISRKTGGTWKDREYLEGSFENVDFLSVPPEHTDHSWFIRYEGPGWENELIGYRAYLDWRNAIDIFGKKVDTLVLQEVGQDGFDSYHEEADWGMDILKAGKSLGIGSIGRMNADGTVQHFEKTDSVTCEISRNGFLSSSIITNYYGWTTDPGKCNLTSKFTILAGDRATSHKVSFNQRVDNFCTGIVKHPEGEYFTKESGNWGYIATFGKQTLFDDHLGMAICYRIDEVEKIETEDPYSHLVIFKPSDHVTYQFLGAWEKEPEGFQNKEEFTQYLDRKLEILNAPLLVNQK